MIRFCEMKKLLLVKRMLRKIREIMIAEALDEDPPSDFENDIEDEDD